MEKSYGDSNVHYLVPKTLIQAYTHIDDNTCSNEGMLGSQLAFGCCCEEDSSCSDETCACIAVSDCNYNQNGTLMFIDSILDDPYFTKAVFECNDCCICAQSCPNRVVQRGLAFKLQVFQTSDRGCGVKALQQIPKGSYVIDYAGDILDRTEAFRRMKTKEETQCNYLLTVRETFGTNLVTTYIDAARFGNVSRFINHSCKPNLLLHPVRVNSSVPRLALFAKQDILPNDELSFDYGGGNDPGCNEREQGKIPCKCGFAQCKGYLPSEPLSDGFELQNV